MYYRMFSIPGPYYEMTVSILAPVLIIKNVFRHCQMSHGGKTTLIKNHWSKAATDSQRAIVSSHLIGPDNGLQHVVG